mgnify:CR=1 FL=1
MRKIFLYFILFSVFFILFDVKGEENLYGKFLERWKLYFGSLPEVSNDFVEKQEKNENLFRKIWEVYSQYLPVEERISAESVFRYHLLNDDRALLNALYSCYNSSRLFPQKNGGILFYLFAEEEIADPSIIPQILPAGENGSNFMETLRLFGESESEIRTRMAVFILKKCVENRIFRLNPNNLPLIFTMTERLKESEVVFARITTSDDYYSIKGELKGDLKEVKVISLFIDTQGRIEKIGVADGKNSPILIPSQRGNFILAILNASTKEQEDLFSATFWKDFNPPLSIVSAEVEDGFLKITIEENSGIFGYKVEMVSENNGEMTIFSPLVKSLGQGSNDYLFSIENSELQEQIFLKVYTLGGFILKIPINIKK